MTENEKSLQGALIDFEQLPILGIGVAHPCTISVAFPA